jgi:Mn-dependent DtxR family transcriptional regulator
MESRTTIVDLMSVVVCRIRPSIHAASERLIDRIDAFLGHPAVDPHGDPIPCADGSLTEIQGTSLSARDSDSVSSAA